MSTVYKSKDYTVGGRVGYPPHRKENDTVDSALINKSPLKLSIVIAVGE